MGYDASVISAAVAQESHAGKASTKGSKAGTGSQSGGKADQASGGKGVSGQGSKSTEALLKGDGGSSSAKGGPTDESDAPIWAGVKGGKSGGGGKPTGGTKKGDLYGDLYVLIREPGHRHCSDRDAHNRWRCRGLSAGAGLHCGSDDRCADSYRLTDSA